MADIHMSLAGMALTGWSAATYPNTKPLELQIPSIFRYSDKPVGCQPPNIVSIEAAGSILNQDQSVVPRKPKLLGVAGAGWRPVQDVLFPDLRQKCPKIPMKRHDKRSVHSR